MENSMFSWGSSVSYVDGYAYDFKTNTWSKLADVVINGEKTYYLEQILLQFQKMKC